MIPAAWRTGEVAVLGIGRSGSAAARWLGEHGVTVYASDAGDSPELQEKAAALRTVSIEVDVGGHDVERIARAAAVVVSPGVPPDIEPLRAARARDVEILAELDLAVRNLPDTRFVVVTGTNGKTTTTALIAHLLQASGEPAEAAGNIGRPLIELAVSPPPKWCVVEASSFQLHDAPHLVATVGVLTNLAPDHQNRYESVADYYDDKRRLFQSASGTSQWVLNADDPAVVDLASGVPGGRRQFSLHTPADGWFDPARNVLMLGGDTLIPRPALPLLGAHNVANALAAALAATAVGVSPDVLRHALPTFPAPAHRLEPVGERDGVRWINDSKATNVASAVAGLRSMVGPFVWIAGGQDKGEDFGPLAHELTHCRMLIAYGEAGPRLATTLRDAVETRITHLLTDAADVAAQVAAPGDIVLLTPACASFDQFADFEARGEHLRRYVTSA